MENSQKESPPVRTSICSRVKAGLLVRNKLETKGQEIVSLGGAFEKLDKIDIIMEQMDFIEHMKELNIFAFK